MFLHALMVIKEFEERETIKELRELRPVIDRTV
jgi:hypothetical protein